MTGTVSTVVPLDRQVLCCPGEHPQPVALTVVRETVGQLGMLRCTLHIENIYWRAVCPQCGYEAVDHSEFGLVEKVKTGTSTLAEKMASIDPIMWIGMMVAIRTKAGNAIHGKLVDCTDEFVKVEPRRHNTPIVWRRDQIEKINPVLFGTTG